MEKNQREESRLKKYIILCLLIFWCALIFFFSADNSAASNSKSGEITNQVIQTYEKVTDTRVSTETKKEIKKDVNYLVRKMAHFSLYFVLGIFSILFFKHFVKSPRNLILASILFCLFYAGTDEFHQLFTGRTGSLFDVCIDTLGSSVSILFTFYFLNRTEVNYWLKNLTNKK